MTWKLAERLRVQLQKERGYYQFPHGVRSRFALVYPNSYHVGMSNLGIHIIYEILNQREDTSCERFFLPEKDEWEEYVRTRTPLLSMETQSPLQDFPVIGFAVSFEMDYFHVLDMLSVGHVPLWAAQRGAQDPIVIAGGPCATFNPEPLAPFIDAFVIGEGEETIANFMDAYYAAVQTMKTRTDVLKALARVPGVYVPRFYMPIYAQNGTLASVEVEPGIPTQIFRQWVRDLDAYPAHTVVVTEDTEFNLYLIETARGCGRHCRFCMAGYCFRRPRNRSRAVLQKSIQEAKMYGKRVGLMGAAISDYPEIDVLCEDIRAAELPMSVASFRADSVTPVLMDTLVQSGMKTLTMAPEAGSEKLRAVINKGIDESHLWHALDLGIAAGLRHYRLYLMIGLPGETDEDLDAIVDLSVRMKQYLKDKGNKGTLTLSVNPFVPKPFTPFQWLPMADKKDIESALKRLRKGLKNMQGIELLAESTKGAYVQGILARGDRRLAPALAWAQENGGAKAFLRAMKEHDLDASFYLYRMREDDERFPWEVLDMGVSRDYLWRELQRAQQGTATVACFDGCKRCGVCDGV